MTPAEAQAEIRSIAEELLSVEDRLRRVWEEVPRSPDEDAMFEGRRAWDLATEIRTVAECSLEDLRGVSEALERASGITQDRLRKEFGQGTDDRWRLTR